MSTIDSKTSHEITSVEKQVIVSHDSQIAEVRKWYHWYEPTDTPEERRLLLKCDLCVVLVAFIFYWTKYIDQTNINNAWVSGLATDLNLHGNELSQFQAIYTVGAVVFQLPGIYLFTKVPIKYLAPGMQFFWGIFSLLQYRSASYAEVMAYRFLVGVFESNFYMCIHYTLGSWYKDYEIGRRGGCFYIGLTLGTLTSSLLQGAAAKHLDGVDNLAGWRWMFIINGIITLPIGILGFLVWPGTPDYCRSIFFTQADAELAKRRMADSGHAKPTHKLTLALFKKVFTSLRFYVLIIWSILFWNGGLNYSVGGYLLWLKSLNRFSVSEVNNLGAISPALGILWVLLICFSADIFRSRAGALMASHFLNSLGLLILIIWNTPESAKWFAFQLTYFGVAMSSVLYGWTNDIVKGNNEERIIYLVLMNAIGQGTTAFTVILTFPTEQAPRFKRGYIFVFVCSVLLILFTNVVNYIHKKQIAEEANKVENVTDSDESIVTEI